MMTPFSLCLSHLWARLLRSTQRCPEVFLRQQISPSVPVFLFATFQNTTVEGTAFLAPFFWTPSCYPSLYSLFYSQALPITTARNKVSLNSFCAQSNSRTHRKPQDQTLRSRVLHTRAGHCRPSTLNMLAGSRRVPWSLASLVSAEAPALETENSGSS